jgi:hypothetical protein
MSTQRVTEIEDEGITDLFHLLQQASDDVFYSVNLPDKVVEELNEAAQYVFN